MTRKQNKILVSEKWDNKSTKGLLSVIVLFLLLFSLFYMPKFLREKKNENFKGKTNGIILSVTPVSAQSENFDGGKMITAYYKVVYRYRVNNQVYVSNNNIPSEGKYNKLINQVYNSNIKDSINIKYKINNPQESIIEIK